MRDSVAVGGSGAGELGAEKLGTRELDAEECLLCGSPDPLGLIVCEACAGGPASFAGSDCPVPAGPSSRLIFLRRSGVRERRQLVARLLEATGEPRRSSQISAALNSELPLARVSSRVAERAVAHLRQAGLGARVVHPARLDHRLPSSLGAMLCLVLISGMLAGATVAPAMLYLTPLYAATLAVLAVRRQRKPLLRSQTGSPALPAAAAHEVRDTLATLPQGAARGLLANIVRMSSGLYRDGSAGPETADTIDELLRHACTASTNLASLDESLSILEDQRPPKVASKAWSHTTSAASRARETLARGLFEALTTLGRARTAGAGSGWTAAHLSKLSRDLERESLRQAEARNEVELLLTADL